MPKPSNTSTRAKHRVPPMTLIRQLRLRAGLSQASLAAKAQLSLGWVSVVEREPGLLTVPVAKKLAHALNCNALEILPPREE